MTATIQTKPGEPFIPAPESGLAVELTGSEIQTVKHLIEDWGWGYALKANRDDVVALARRFGLAKLADDLTV